MKTKKTVTPFNMQEIARALREMISEDSPNASEALLSGTREAVFREIFIFHYPSFLEKLYQSDRKSTRLNSSHPPESRMPSSA